MNWCELLDTQNDQLPSIRKLYMENGLLIKLTCGACPEQYDVYDLDVKQVAYYRLRHGEFRVDVPDHNGVTIYEAEPKGDGIFDDDERIHYMTEAMNRVLSHLNEKNGLHNKT